MTSWTRQLAPCVFCEYRALFKSIPFRIKSHNVHSQSGSARATRSQSRRRNSWREEDGLNNGTGHRRTAAALKHHQNGKGKVTNRGTSFAERYSLQNGTSHKRTSAMNLHFGRGGKLIKRGTSIADNYFARRDAEILTALSELKLQLEQGQATEDSQISQYDALDPDKKHWPVFEDNLRLLILKNKAKSEVRSETKGLWTDLIKPGSSGQLKRVLHFAFADHVLQNQEKDQASFVNRFADLRYPSEWYTGARAAQRDIHLHVGPTNSGKTYNALKRLEEAGDGFYAGPLRLLAHEVYMRFKSKGIPCDLVTGDDIRRDQAEEVKLYSSTVEMVDVGRQVSVAVIDEIQMMAQEERGWAWTRALLGANAKEVHICGELRVIPLIQELAGWMGDNLEIHRYDRLNPLKAMSRSLRGDLKNLRKGDCVVAFSIVVIHALKKQIEVETGRRVAIVYGSLPPETRAQQAALFNNPDNDFDYLVASNAIGMGLNLAIKRIVFDSTMKFNGVSKERLSIPEIKQIAGRAGRYRTAPQSSAGPDLVPSNPADLRSTQYHATATVGLVTCLDEVDLPFIQEALTAEPEPIKKAGILPPTNFVEEYATRLPKGLPFEYVYRRFCEIAVLHPRFQLSDIRDPLGILKQIEHLKTLTVAQRCTIAASPADARSMTGQKVISALAKCLADAKSVSVADVSEIPLEVLEQPISGERNYLVGLEHLHKALILFLWLSYRFVGIFKDQDMAFHAKTLVEEKINTTLLEFSANPQLRKRLLALKNQPVMGRPNLDGPDRVTARLSTAEPDTEEVMDDQDVHVLSSTTGPDIKELMDTQGVPAEWPAVASGFAPEITETPLAARSA